MSGSIRIYLRYPNGEIGCDETYPVLGHKTIQSIEKGLKTLSGDVTFVVEFTPEVMFKPPMDEEREDEDYA